jgi:8-oxo-dGTP pyrophosphatase MutT (NUDIX family)
VTIAKLTKKAKVHQQVGALPLRLDDDQTRVLLITTRGTRRWTIPKGWPMRGFKDHRAAEREALEEAGVVGRVAKDAVGTYQYWKKGVSTLHLCEVAVYLLHVDRQLTDWREKGQRVATWFSIAEARTLVEEVGLQAIIGQIGPPS